MALTISKWTGATALACAVVWAWLFHTRSQRAAVEPFPVQSAIVTGAATSPAVSSELNRAIDRLRLLQIRDSIAALASKSGDDLTVLVDAGYGPSLARAIEVKMHQRWDRVPRRGGVPVVVAAVVDSSSTVLGYQRRKPTTVAPPMSTFLPTSETGGRCISIVRVPMALDARSPKYIPANLLSPESVDGLLSPCIYYATFGPPGPEIERWLRDVSWRVAHHADWSTSSPQWDADRARDVARVFGPLASGDDASWAVRFAVATPGLACLGGMAGRCLEAATARRPSGDDSTWDSNVVASYGTNQFSFYLPSRPTNLGPYDGWLLSEMARSLGDAKFAAFWKSRATVPEAFRAASGEDLDGWIRGWGRRIYGSMSIGPGLPASSIVAGFGAIGLALWLAVAIARRRRVM